MAGEDGADPGADQHFDASCLLTGLPDLAAQALVQCLVASGSTKLTELLTLCRAARQLVLQHAASITYFTKGASHRSGLHAACTRRSGKLHVFLVQAWDAAADRDLLSPLLFEAAQQTDAEGGRGWTAVSSLKIVGWGADEGKESAPWMHLVGPAAPHMEQLCLKCVQLQPAMYPSLAVCRQLTTLELTETTCSDAAVRELPMLASLVPSLTSLIVDSWEMAPVVEALAQQLQQLTVHEVPPQDSVREEHAVLARCKHLQQLSLPSQTVDDAWMGVLLSLPALRVLNVWRISDLQASYASATSAWELTVDVVNAAVVPKLPLASLAQLDVELELTLTADAGHVSHVAGSAVQALLPLAHQGRMPSDMAVSLVLAAGAQGPVPHTVQAALRSLHPLVAAFHPFQQLWVYLQPGLLEQFTGAEVRALAGGGSCDDLLELGVQPGAPLSHCFWSSLLPAFPKLEHVGVEHSAGDTWSLDAADLTLFLARCPKPVGVHLHNGSDASKQAFRQVMAAFKGQAEESCPFLRIVD